MHAYGALGGLMVWCHSQFSIILTPALPPALALALTLTLTPTPSSPNPNTDPNRGASQACKLNRKADPGFVDNVATYSQYCPLARTGSVTMGPPGTGKPRHAYRPNA